MSQRRVKFFKTLQNDLLGLENHINEWAQRTGAEIVSVTGNIAPQSPAHDGEKFSSSDVLVVVLYELPAA